MFARSFIILAVLFTSLYSKECYFNKNDKKICLKRFYNKKALEKPYVGEKYYIFPDGKIYTFKDKIQMKLNYKGAILYILDNFDVEFVDTKSYGTYIVKVKNKNEIFSILTNLNNLPSVKTASLVMKRKYKKGYIKSKQELLLERAEKKKEQKGRSSGRPGGGMQGFKFGG